MKHYLTRKEVAEHYPVSVSELAQLASRGTGPRFFKPTAKALYLAEDIEAWIESHVVLVRATPTSQVGALPATAGKAIGTATSAHGGEDDTKRTGGRRRKSLLPSAESCLRRDPNPAN